MYQRHYTITIPAQRPAEPARRRRRSYLETADKVYRTAVLAVVFIACCFVLAGIIHERTCLAEREQQTVQPPLPVRSISSIMETATPTPAPMPEPVLVTLQMELPVPAASHPEIPMSAEYQEYMRTYCEKYGCPYELALAVAEAESRFDMDAIGSVGEVGMMQLNPGPGGSYHAEVEAATGLDPTTPEGNIAGGCWMLGKYMTEYQDMGLVAMAYNMGQTGARRAWEAGAFSTDYSRKILQGAASWKEILEG